MAQVINTNVASLFAGVALNKSADGLMTAQQRLSSGLRINSVKDDSTGLAIASGYDTQIRGTNVATRNANDAITQAQTLDGYGGQMLANLQRLYEIYVQTGDVVNDESKALVAENARIATLSGTVDLIGAKVTVDGAGTTVAAKSTALAAPAAVTAAGVLTDISAVIATRSLYGSDIATYSSAVATMQTTSVNLSASYSRIMDTDYAAESTNQSKNQILQQAGIASLAQSNQNPSMVLTLLR